jgi:tetratricopeptide (TPR) repeat protein
MKDPETLALVDLDLCLERAASLLLEPGPTPQKLEEAHRLLDLILSQKPAMKPRVAYWRSVAHTHARLYDQATTELEHVLDPTLYAPDDAERRSVLLPAWQLALTLHEELRRRVGVKQLALPGRRMDAIGAVERQLAENTDDAAAWNLKRLLYQDVAEGEYDAAAAPGQTAPDFDHSYVQQLGLALINDPARWQRGGEYLRMAARGLPAFGPTLFIQIAQANQRAGIIEGAWQNYELAKRAGRAVGPKNLSDEDRQAYFATVKMLGDAALERGDTDAALENFHLFSESERSGVETLRTLADLYERKGDPLAACRLTEQALVYNSKDKDLLERKDKYYYSVMPDVLQANLEAVRAWFDTAYCLWKAGELLKVRGADLDLIDWAEHLIRLARVVLPDSLAAKVLLARALLRRGEKDEAVTLFEDVYKNKPAKLYLEELGRPDLAVPCFQDFRKSPKSGADTMYRLGQAYEQLGERTKATKCYDHVTSYESHPLAPDAREALYRLQA